MESCRGVGVFLLGGYMQHSPSQKMNYLDSYTQIRADIKGVRHASAELHGITSSRKRETRTGRRRL